MTVKERFWEKVHKGPGCWEWTAASNHLGYGYFGLGTQEDKTTLAHRWSWEQEHGPIPDGLLICHHCDNPPCVRPSHLFMGTQKDNVRDGMAKGRYDNRRTAPLKPCCPHGHPYSRDNLHISIKGWRLCRACNRERGRRIYAMKKVASIGVCLFLISTFLGLASGKLILPIVEVYDGDTIHTRALLPSPLDKISIRVLGIDTPEMPAKSYEETGKLGRAKCEKEAELAIQAKEVVQTLVDQSYGWMEMTNYKWGKFGGRIVGEVVIDGVSVRELLLMKGYAVEYHGEKKTKDWCASE